MNILVFCYEYPPIGGGAGNALSHLSKSWASAGHDVTVVTSGHGQLPAEQCEQGVRILRLFVGRKSVSRGRLIEMLRYMIISRSISESLYRRVRPDLAVAFMTLPCGAAPIHLHRKFGLPFATELRGGDVPGFLPEQLSFFHLLTKRWILRTWRRSAVVIANSDGLAHIARKAAPEVDIQVIPNGVDADVFKPAGSRDPVRGRCRCIFVGRLVDTQKQVGRLIDAVGHDPQLELTIVGAGPDEGRLRQRAAASGAADRITFTGWLKGDVLLQQLQTADIYVSASIAEGMSNSALEALACGLPLVLSRISGHQELVEDGKNGFLFDVGSQADLERRLKLLAGDLRLRAACAAASRELADREFGWDVLASRHLKLYRRAISA